MDEQIGTDKHDLLDRMLAAYGEVQMPAGLETRVLGTIERTANRRRRRFWFILGGPAAATAAALFLLWSRPAGTLERKPVLSISTVPKDEIRKTAPANSEAPVSSQVSTLPVESAAANSETPRQSTFPAPSEPSAGERAFLSLIISDEQGLVPLVKLFPSERRSIDPFPISLEPVSLAAVYVNVEQIGESPNRIP